MSRADFLIDSTREITVIGKTTLGSSTDGRGIVRPAIFLKEGSEGGSVDIFAVDGTHLCQVNLFDFGDGKGNVDVILFGEKQASAIIFRAAGNDEPGEAEISDGRVDATLPGAQTFAVNIKGGKGAPVRRSS